MNARGSECNCHALRAAARHLTQAYDQFLAHAGLRTTQFAILAQLERHGPLTINALAGSMVMDRTTLGRNILPLQRDGLVEVVASEADRRRRELRLTREGIARQSAAVERWVIAQQRFDAVFGGERAAALRGLLHEVVASEFVKAG